MSKKKRKNGGKPVSKGFRILQRQFKDGKVKFFIEVTNNYEPGFGFKYADSEIYEKEYDSYDDAFEAVTILKKKDDKVTYIKDIVMYDDNVVEEKTNIVNSKK